MTLTVYSTFLKGAVFVELLPHVKHYSDTSNTDYFIQHLQGAREVGGSLVFIISITIILAL